MRPRFLVTQLARTKRMTKLPLLGATRQSSSSSSSIIKNDEQIMSNILYRIRKVNHVPDDIRSSLLDFSVDGISLGKVRPAIAQLLCSVDDETPVFCLKQQHSQDFLTLTEKAGDSFETRTASVNRIMKKLADDGVVTGWRDEDYPVKKTFYDEPLFGVERASVPLLGVMEYGVHINGIVQGDSDNRKDVKMWIARRAPDKSKYPGMLDHVVAGGQPVGLSLMENVIKECKEEAGIPEATTIAGIQAAGAISYETYSDRSDCVTRCVLFNYDLHLPKSFQPQPVDGEVDQFFLWDIDQIKESMSPDCSDPIKPNCYPVIIDFLLRWGYLSPDTKGYLDVLRELRSGQCL